MRTDLTKIVPMKLPIPIISVLIGAIVLFFGRRLFWLFVAAVGFAAGVELAPWLVHEPSSLLVITAALVLGFIGALLALFLQKIAIALVGFVAGGRLAVAIVAAFLVQHQGSFALTFLIGGIVGALLFLLLFDWALIVLSSMVGAYMIETAITLPQTGAAILFIVLTILGIIVQAGLTRRAAASP
jgi:hypothetical protein